MEEKKKILYKNNKKRKKHLPIVEKANKLAVRLTANQSDIYQGDYLNVGTMKLKSDLFDWLYKLINK
jgi:hypothetical protein